jgi:hypothetical protein
LGNWISFSFAIVKSSLTIKNKVVIKQNAAAAKINFLCLIANKKDGSISSFLSREDDSGSWNRSFIF